VVFLEVVVAVPRLALAVPHLHEAHAFLDHAAGVQHLPRLHTLAVHLADVLGLLRQVEDVARLHLHAVGQLERLDA
jgi:hypothetical protein